MKAKMTTIEVTAAVNAAIKAVDYAYEMDCLISMEFTPAPEYREPILNAVTNCGWSLEEYSATLSDEESYELATLTF